MVTWDAASGKPVRAFKVQSSIGLRPPVAFSPDGTRFLPVPSSDQPLTVWDVASEQVLHTFGGRGTNHMYSAAFSPDSAQVASGHIDGALKLWEVATGRLIRTLWHAKSVDAVAFSRDGTKLLSGSTDTTVKLWDTATGQLVRTFDGHSASVRSVAFTPDEKRVISGGYDTTARVWDAATGEQLALLLTAKDDEWLVITPGGLLRRIAQGRGDAHRRARPARCSASTSSTRPSTAPTWCARSSPATRTARCAPLPPSWTSASWSTAAACPLSPSYRTRRRTRRPTISSPWRRRLADQGGGIGRAEWRINGVTVGVVEQATAARQASLSPLKQAMALDPGENTVELVAYNGANLVASAPARAKIIWTGSEPTAPPRLHVLVVGINDYLDASSQAHLRGPGRQDALLPRSRTPARATTRT